MSWTPDLIIGLGANSATAAIATALLMLVLWQAPRRLDNWLFALLMLIFATTGVIGVFVHFAQPLGFHPRQALYVSTSLYAVGIVLMFVFSARFAGIKGAVIGPLAGMGFAVIVVLLPQLWGDRVYVDFTPAASGGPYNYRLASGGVPGLFMLGMYLLLASVVIYRQGQPHLRGLWIAPVVLLGAMLLFFVPLFDKFPKNTVAIAISALILAHTVLKTQLFNPLVELNTRLAEANARLADANAQLIEASRLKSQFLANMSHELRTPLNSIIGYSELILDGTYGPLSDRQADRLEKVVRNGRSLLSLINDILDLSKIEAGRLELAPTPLAIGGVIDGVLDETTLMAEEKSLRIVRAYDGLPPVMADPVRVRQIVLNLVSNALKFTHEGAITVRGEVDPARRQVRIAVSDTGIGIAPGDREMIFDEFRQVDGTATRRYEGTGLGLAITRHLVELHGGTITVDSVPGQGSTFIFTLPLAEARPAPAPDDRPVQAEGGGPLILVIDDSAEAAELIRDVLAAEGYHVLWARGGAEGIDLARRVRPDLVVLDIMMPDMNGWDVLKTLKSDPDTSPIPVVIVSVVERQPISVDVSADGHLSKPVERARLLDLIGTLSRVAVALPAAPILVVDDNPQDRDILCTILRGAGYTAEPVDGGQQAIERLQSGSAALVLLDLMMPEVSGFDVLHFIREQSDQPDLPVIVVSAKDLTPQEQAFLHSRLAELIRKQGLRPQELRARVRAVLGPAGAAPGA
ncbi:MAG: response regulator [Anaerolineae bacterium]|nr:response regulator [Anaerolineae bacterium]